MNVQAVVNNISFPKSLDELRYRAYETGHFNVEDIAHYSEVEWTMPKWAVPNDIVFFFHAKTAISTIRRLELQAEREAPEDKDTLLYWLKKGRRIYDRIGGRIFAIGRVIKKPFYDDSFDEEERHFKGKIFSIIGDIQMLKKPVDISEFSDFLYLSRQSAITAVLGSDFERLKEIIQRKNPLPEYVLKSRATPMPLKNINSRNWLEVTRLYRRSFYLEAQFRRYYVDYFLRAIADVKKIFAECNCYRGGFWTGRADNCIRIDGRLCAVEVKLNVSAESKIETQLEKYCRLDEIELSKKRLPADRLIPDRVMVIDAEKLYFYESENKALSEILDLDSLTENEDLESAREIIIKYLNKN